MDHRKRDASTMAGHGWQLGDDLINYQAGFTRRGLLGSVILAWER